MLPNSSITPLHTGDALLTVDRALLPFPGLITCRSAVTATRRWHQISIADSGSMPLIV